MVTKTSNVKAKNWGDLGGNNKMHSFSGTGTQKPGGSSQEGTGARRGIEPKAGPSDVMGFSTGASNKSYAGTQTAGQTAACPTGGNDKFAKGGSNKMLGNRGSQRAEGGKTAP